MDRLLDPSYAALEGIATKEKDLDVKRRLGGPYPFTAGDWALECDEINLYDPDPDVIGTRPRDAVALAHELGHVLSWEADPQRAIEYRKAAALYDNGPRPPGMTDGQAQLILDEEACAWMNARVLLEHVRFTAWDQYEAAKAYSMNDYRSGLATRQA